MFDGILSLIAQQWENQIFAGGLALGALGTGLALFGRLGWSAFRLLTARMFPSVTVDRRSPLFDYMQAWLAEHPYTGRCRNLTAATGAEGRDDENGIHLVPGEGGHILRQGRVWFWLRRSRATAEGKYARTQIQQETIELRALTPQRGALVGLIDEVVRCHGDRAGTLAFHAAASYGEWVESCRTPRRSLGSVFVADGIDVMLLEDARRFFARQAWYAERGVPWRRGYLFHGQPGTGKTSLIRALASELDLDLAALDLSMPELNDSGLRDLLGSLPKRAALVLEDIDTVAPGRDPKTDRRLSLSGLLNALDGLGAAEGRLMFMTSNHPERLDPALIRPGRIDLSVAIGPLGPADAARMVARFYPDRPDRVAEVLESFAGRDIPAAELQALMLNCTDDLR